MQRLAFTPAQSALARLLTPSVLALGWLVGCLLGGCASERSVLVDVSGAADADRLCLVASDGERVLFSRAYGDDVLGAPTSGSLAFIAGDEVSSSVIITALALRASAIVGTATSATTFGEAGTVTLPLVVSRCHPRSATAVTLVARDVVLIEAVGLGATLATGDVDGDGRDEALVLGLGGTLVTVDVERSRAIANAAIGERGRITATGDLDGDCSLDAVIVTADGVRVLHRAGAMVLIDPVMSDTLGAVDAALGAASSGPRVAVCGPLGVSLVDPHGATGALSLASDPTLAVVAADLTGDRRAEIAAVGPAGARVWIASDAGFIAAPGVLPPSFVGVTERLVILDGNDDGALDLAGAGSTGLYLAVNRGDGTLEDLAGGSLPTAALTALVAVDLDGDCHDELAALAADGTLTLYAAEGALTPRAESFTGVAAIAAGDVDGDGARELVLLGVDGELRVVGP